MVRNVKKLLISLMICLMTSTFLFPLQRLGGSIAGRVVDTEGNYLPGVTVTVSGPFLQGEIVYVTNETGIFRFPSLPSGKDYVLYIEMPGFQNLKREGLRVETGKIISVLITLEMSRLEEEIVITGDSPLVDVKAIKTSLNYTKDLFLDIPIQRDFYRIIDSAPGSFQEEICFQKAVYMSGSTVRDNLYSVDGVFFNDPVFSHPITALNLDIAEEVEFEMFGHPLEVGNASGGFINIITRSGGNSLHGGITAEYYNQDMQKSLLGDKELEAVGLNNVASWNDWRDLSVSLGGSILKDQIWIFTNARYFNWSKDFIHADWNETLSQGKRVFIQDNAPHQEYALFGKLTLRFTSNLRFSTSYNLSSISEDFYTGRLEENRDKTAFSTWDKNKSQIISSRLTWELNQNHFIDARFGYINDYFPLPFSELALPFEPRLYDVYYDIFQNNSEYQETRLRSRMNPSVTATIFKDALFGASHEIKIGADYEWSMSEWDWWRENPFFIHYFQGDLYAYPLSTEPNRTKLFVYNSPDSQGGSLQKNQMTRFGVFFQDAITFVDRLTLNLGVRFDVSKGVFPPHSHNSGADPYGIIDILPGLGQQFSDYELRRMDVIDWKNFSPRIGFAYDLFGDGRTSLRGTWSRYHEYLMIQYFDHLNPIYPQLSSWYWVDSNVDQEPDADDIYTLISLADDPFEFLLEDQLDKDATAPYTDEFTVGIEREIREDLSTGITFIFKHNQNIFENFNDFGLGKAEAWKGYSPESPFWEKFEFQDPGDDGIFGTEDDIRSFCYAETADSPGVEHLYLSNIDDAFRKYTALQFILNKRMSHKWQMLASLVWSKAWGNIGGGIDESGGTSEYFDTPNSFIFPEGRLNYDRPLNIKILSSVILPYNFILSAYFNHRSGSPWNRTVTVFIPEDSRFRFPGGSYSVPTEENGTRRNPSLTTLDLRLEKKFHLTGSLNIGGYIDVMNALGRSGYAISSNPGGYLNYRDPLNPSFNRYSNFGRFKGAYGARMFKVSLRVTF